ncbi:MAG: aspartate aminotransferase [Planctomycetota bacterium]
MLGISPNSRASKIAESATLAITATANRLRAAGGDVVSLAAGEPDFPVPEPIAEAGVTAIRTGNTRYTPAAGTPVLRKKGAEWLQRQFGLHYDADEVMVCPGAKSALHMVLDAVVEPGDRVLIPAPYWVSYPALVTMAGGEGVVLPAVPERGFLHAPEAIADAAVRHGARGIILNFPNNPSGAVPDRAHLQALVDVARAHDLWILSDEIYATLLYDGAEHISPATLPGGRERTAVVTGFTKSLTLTGWRASFLAAPRELIAACARIQSQVLGNTCTISQAAYEVACETPLPEEHAKRMAAFDERRRYLVAEINAIQGLKLATPRGAFYALVDARELLARRRQDDVAFCHELLEKHLLAVVPGSAFAIPGFVRISYAAPLQDLEKAVARLRAAATER